MEAVTNGQWRIADGQRSFIIREIREIRVKKNELQSEAMFHPSHPWPVEASFTGPRPVKFYFIWLTFHTYERSEGRPYQKLLSTFI